MAGTWTLGEEKIRPGTYYRVSSGDVTTVGAVNGVAAVIFQSNWGSLNRVTNITQSDLNNLQDIFGEGAGVEAIREALKGGATLVKAIRVGTGGKSQKAFIYSPEKLTTRDTWVNVDRNGVADFLTDSFADVVNQSSFAVKARIGGDSLKKFNAKTDYTLEETKSNGRYTKREVHFTAAGLAKLPESRAVRIYEAYVGSGTGEGVKVGRIWSRFMGDKAFTCTLKTDLVNGKRILNFYDDNQRLFDSVTFVTGGDEVAKLKAALDANKNFHLARVYGSGLISDFNGRKMTDGTNPQVTVVNYADATDQLERHWWNVVLADSDDAKIKNILNEFVKQSYETGRLGMTVLAGLNTESFENRLKEATSLNDWRTVYLLHGWTAFDGTTYDGWKAAARLGGMIAACETNSSLTHITIDNASELLENLSSGEMEEAQSKGCVCLSLNDDGQIWLDNAINTLLTLGNNMDEGWKKIRRTKCRFELMTRINRTCDRLIGRLNNDTNGRATLVTAMQKIINEMIAEGKLFAGSYVAEDSRHKAVGDKAYFVLYIGDIDSIEKIYLDYQFSYSNPFA